MRMKRSTRKPDIKSAAHKASAKSAPARKEQSAQRADDAWVAVLESLSADLDQLFASQGFALKVR